MHLLENVYENIEKFNSSLQSMYNLSANFVQYSMFQSYFSYSVSLVSFFCYFTHFQATTWIALVCEEMQAKEDINVFLNRNERKKEIESEMKKKKTMMKKLGLKSRCKRLEK